MNSNHRPNYKRIFKDIIQLKFPEKENELNPFFEKEQLSALDVIRLNQLLFNSNKKQQQAKNSKYKSYTKTDILKILEYQKKHNLTNIELAKEFKMSRNTITKWKKTYAH